MRIRPNCGGPQKSSQSKKTCAPQSLFPKPPLHPCCSCSLFHCPWCDTSSTLSLTPYHLEGKEGVLFISVSSAIGTGTATERCKYHPASGRLCDIGKTTPPSQQFLARPKSTASVAGSPRQRLSTSWSGTWDNYSCVNSCYQAQHGRGQVRLTDQTLTNKCPLLVTYVTPAHSSSAKAIHMAMPNIKKMNYIYIHIYTHTRTYMYTYIQFSPFF